MDDAVLSNNTSPFNTSSNVSNLHLRPDELTLHLIASGLLMLVQQSTAGRMLTIPYPASLQRGLDRLVLACIQRGILPPQSVPDLLNWCRLPIATWQLELPPETTQPHDYLLDGNLPTTICEAWACASPDVEAELSEQRLLRSVFDVCKARQIPESYVAFRRLLIKEPAMTALTLRIHCTEPDLEPLTEQLHAAYEPAPIAHMLDGVFVCCATCGNLLLREAGDKLVCEEERCRRANKIVQGERLAAREDVMWLKRGLRRFIAAPGRAELRLSDALIEQGLNVTLWPAFDRYDLRVVFPDNEVWAIDVKDWANPFLLARQVKPIPADPPWTRAFFVFPDERRSQRADYVRAFQHSCSVLNQSTGACFERDLLDAALRKFEEVC